MAIVRPINLIIILLTMVVVQSNIYAHANQVSQWGIQWWLKTLIMILLAASGNVINDIWDQKVDAINKKKPLIGSVISLSMSKRWYGILIFFLFIISFQFYLFTKNASLLNVPLVMAIGLFLYTPIFKRVTWLGNIWVAACVGFVPLWVMMGKWSWTFQSETFTRVFFLSIMAFWVNWIREIVKDFLDFKGDIQCGYKSLPITYGREFSIKLIRLLLLLLLLQIGLYIFICEQLGFGKWWAALLMFIPGLVLFYMTTGKWELNRVKKLSFLLKVWMVLALIQFYFS